MKKKSDDWKDSSALTSSPRTWVQPELNRGSGYDEYPPPERTTHNNEFVGDDDDDEQPSSAGAPESGRHRRKRQQVMGAAVLGGVAGLVLVGPVMGVAAAGGAAAVAATHKGRAGHVTRASGDFVVRTGQRLQRFDQKHGVVEKTSRGVVQGSQWISRKLQPASSTSSPQQHTPSSTAPRVHSS